MARLSASLLIAALLPTAALANGLDDFLAFNTATKTATARFEQQVFDRSGKAIERAEGTFAFARPGKFRWTYDKPHKQVLVGDGAKLWIHDPDLNQVTVKRMDGAISSTPAALLAGRDDITKLFTLTDSGAADGLVPSGRGFRTIYGAIVAIVDDAEAGKPAHTVETSARAVVDSILRRNAHQALSVPVRADRPLAGAPAASAVLNGISPVTSRGERAEVVCRAYGSSQILYVILVSPTDAYPDLEQPLRLLRDSIRVNAEK